MAIIREMVYELDAGRNYTVLCYFDYRTTGGNPTAGVARDPAVNL
jgi:hypothetical protein